ncbi:phosphatase PAP2 family protein [Fluviicola taffensis]|uniref:phosphatase PAP2 family protein n=1 Tax=Fluviicola taffensis TaxID=191579 RepID=UPI003137C40F
MRNIFPPLNLKELIWTTTGSVCYLILSRLLIGFKIDQLVLVLLFNALFYASNTTRRFILGFLIFIVFWIVFDYMKVIPNYLVNDVHIEDLYIREKSLFGIETENGLLTPNEFADQYSHLGLDLMSGFFYLNWIPVPLFFAFYLFSKNKALFLQFALSFLLVNLIGFMVYYIYPAAPPWYVKEYGFEFLLHTPGHTGTALSHFDDFFGVEIFQGLYSKSSNVFAAMPSLHSAYPVVVLYFGLKKKVGWVNILLALFMIGIWFSAVYTGHHYIQDVVGGILCAITGLFIFEKLLLKSPGFNRFLKRYEMKIT